MSNNLKNSLTKGVLLVFFLNMFLFSATAHAQVNLLLNREFVLSDAVKRQLVQPVLPADETANQIFIPSENLRTQIPLELIKPKLEESQLEENTNQEEIQQEETQTEDTQKNESQTNEDKEISIPPFNATPDPKLLEKEETSEFEPKDDKDSEDTEEHDIKEDIEERDINAQERLFYVQLMRAVRDLKEGKARDLEKEKKQLIVDIENFIAQEKASLEKSGVSNEKLANYIDLLHTQTEEVKALNPAKIEEYIKKSKELPEEQLLKRPSLFKFTDDKVTIKSIKVSGINLKPAKRISFLDTINPFIIATVNAAATQFMPIIDDIQETSEISLSYEIQELAEELNRNPVQIVNYIYSNIDYEPYFGAKKGSLGCLKEKVCNDTDTASLTIALMRASGIPARYKKGVAVMPVQQIKELLGVDEVKTAYYAFATNKVPVYVLSGNPVGANIDAYDFSIETHLAVEWTYPEIFYDYDERGANFSNTLDLYNIQTTQELRDLFADGHKKQWIPADGITKSYTRIQREIVHDTAAFNTQNFWNGFLQYQGTLSPIEKYIQDLQAQTGKNINNEQYQTTKQMQARNLDILPSTRPYFFGQGVDESNNTIDIETWSQLPEIRRFRVAVSLLRSSDNSVVINKNFYSYEINNVPLDIMYEGATETDQQVIDSYGGIHMTPTSLVNIKPYFLSDFGKEETANTLTIGQPLILQFEYFINGNSIYLDQKKSVAGNAEGIYIVLSKIQDIPYLNDGIDDNSQILIEGNARLAWKYIREVEAAQEMLEKALDYEVNNHFIRAVITQNRILSEVGGVPTTFDFKGLTMDASSYINDYSNRGNFKLHNKDFRLLWGQQASYYEGQIFTEVTNTDAISTVKGLQYAYANPAIYTIHTITTANEHTIDTLNLSANTKQNMHADVQAGRTIVTPDKQVTQGTFTGTLYTSIAPNGTGTYAIGEQNGAWQTAGLSEAYSYIEGMALNSVYSYVYGSRLFLYEDRDGYSFICNISESAFNSTFQEAGWDSSYGVPCYVPSVPPGQTYAYEYDKVNQSFKVATNATKFWRSSTHPEHSSYTYWHKNKEIIQRLTNYAANQGLNNSRKVRFSIPTGTFVKNITYDTHVLYYTPFINGSDKGRTNEVKGDFFNRFLSNSFDTGAYLCSINAQRCALNKVFDHLGFPVGNIIPINSEWSYQNFVGGRIYGKYLNYLGRYLTYYVPGQINQYYVNNGYHSTGGFPIGNPEYNNNTHKLVQDFEKVQIVLHNQVASNGQIVTVITASYILNDDADYIEGFFDELSEDNIIGIAIDITAGIGISHLASALINKLSSSTLFKAVLKKGAVRFFPVVGWALFASAIIITADSTVDLTNKCKSNQSFQGADPIYYCGKRDAVLVLVFLGVLGDQVAQSKVAKNVYKVTTQKAKQIKSKLFAMLDIDNPNINALHTASLNYRIHRNKFFENLEDIVNNTDTRSVNNLLAEPKLMDKMFLESSVFYNKFKIKKIIKGHEANAQFPTDTNPLPFTPNSTASSLQITNLVSADDFIRFHNLSNPQGKYLIRRKDVPYKNGKIDKQKVKDLFQIDGDITRVSKYLPNTNDIFVEGLVNKSDQSRMQYAIKGWADLSPSERESRYILDNVLTNLL